MKERKVSMMVSAALTAAALVGCAADVDQVDRASGSEVDQPAAISPDGDSQVDMAEQALGSPAGVLPLHGTAQGIVESKFLGRGMTYAMRLRTGSLVDQVTMHFYTPSRADNLFSPGDPTFIGGPVGGTAGSAQPLTTCPAGYAGYGLFGGSGKHIDRLGLVCARIGSDGRPVTSDVKVLDAWGGAGGTFFYDVCGEGKWLSGMVAGAALKSSGSNKIISFVQGYCNNAR
jgi:hypothetical protein